MSTNKNTTANTAKTNTTLDMKSLIECAHKHNVCFYATNNKSTQYRILNGKSSINIQKTQYTVYSTDNDILTFGKLDIENRKFTPNKKYDGIEIEIDTNTRDGVRPNVIKVKPNAIDTYFDTIAKNTANLMQ